MATAARISPLVRELDMPWGAQKMLKFKIKKKKKFLKKKTAPLSQSYLGHKKEHWKKRKEF